MKRHLKCLQEGLHIWVLMDKYFAVKLSNKAIGHLFVTKIENKHELNEIKTNKCVQQCKIRKLYNACMAPSVHILTETMQKPQITWQWN